MSWIIYAFLAVPFASLYSLAQKWGLNLKISRLNFLFWSFLGSFFCYFLYNFWQNQLLPTNLMNFLLWGGLLAILSIVGNFFSISAMDKTPNPGYVQTIVSANSLFIILATSIILKSSISFWPVMGTIIAVLGFWPLFSRKSDKEENNWQLFAVLAMLFYTAMATVNRYMLTTLDFAPSQNLMILFFYGTIICSVVIAKFKIEKEKITNLKLAALSIFLAVIGSFFGNLLAFVSDQIALNAGYGRAIYNTNAILSLVIALFLFPKEKGGEFNLLRLLGVILVVGGLFVVIITVSH